MQDGKNEQYVMCGTAMFWVKRTMFYWRLNNPNCWVVEEEGATETNAKKHIEKEMIKKNKK